VRRDLRDPTAIGRLLLDGAGSPAYGARSIVARADELPRYLLPQTPGDESPVEKYGDPRLYDVEVVTVRRRVPTRRGLLAAADETYAALKPIERLA